MMTRKTPILMFISLLAATGIAGVFYPDGATTMHFAFEGSPNGDRPIIRPPAFYLHSAGFGFVDSPDLIGTVSGVQAPKYFRFDVNIPPGTYDVSVRVGSPNLPSNTTISAENHHPMAANIQAAPRGNAVANFTVEVKTSKDPKETSLDLDDRLTLEFTGDNPSMMKLDIKPHVAPAAPAK